MIRVWPRCWQFVGGPWDKRWDFVAVVWPKSGYCNFLSFRQVRNFLGGPTVRFTG